MRCYGVDDTFKHAVDKGATFCGLPLARWMEMAGVSESDLWPSQVSERDWGTQTRSGGAEHTLWNARIFPAEPIAADAEPWRRWLWFFDVANATAEDKARFLAADRYSALEIATLVDQTAFHARRSATRADEIERAVHGLFRLESPFSARDLAFALERSPRRERMVGRLLTLAHDHLVPEFSVHDANQANFSFARIVHSLGSALGEAGPGGPEGARFAASGCRERTSRTGEELEQRQLPDLVGGQERRATGAAAFANWHSRTCRSRSSRVPCAPRNGRGMRCVPTKPSGAAAPARIELAGGWTDTPPYTLEFGGDVTNTAINLNGQPPIHCYCRILEEPVVRLNSIDGGRRLEINDLSELTDYHRPGDPFALAKAALAISGFAPGMADWPEKATLREMLEHFGGGIEITTLVGIPQGSGLGTSSILGATILGVIARLVGQKLTQQELFHNVLRLEQALTTGGGWQDQVGGCVGGSKITSTRPGLFPDARIHYVPSDVLDPRLNGGCTLLYYTGLTRIAKDILKEIVGGYLNRDRAIMQALAEEHLAARAIAETMSRKDIAAFGECLDSAWELQKRLCGTVTNAAIEELLGRVRPFVHGMRISGAGSGGFLLMVAKSPGDAARIRQTLEDNPMNDRSRFFDFEVNNAGLEVTTC